MEPIYLDNNATTRPLPEVVAAMHSSLTEEYANASSVHRAGQIARQKMELAREQVCRLIGCRPRELIFTSGGTESSSLAIHGVLNRMLDNQSPCVVISSKLEHSATRETLERLHKRGCCEVIWADITRSGMIDLEALEATLADNAAIAALVTLQWINNETGTIQPVEAIGALCRQNHVLFHCDATQAIGKIECNVQELPIDLMTFSAHKFHGSKGVGGLYVRRGVRVQPEIIGGPQERERRGGTENSPGIVGMGVAAEAAIEFLQSKEPARIENLRNRFEQNVLASVPTASINTIESQRIWNTTNIAFEKLEAEAILLLLSERGIYASAGAACSSGSLDPSPVLLAMNIEPARAHGSVRFSLSRMTTDEEIDRAIEIVPQVIEKLSVSMV